MRTSLESVSQTHFAWSSILILFMKKAHDQLIFFSVIIVISFQILTMKYKRREDYTTQSCTPLVQCFTFQILLFDTFMKFKNHLNKIHRFWRYATIGIIVSLLTLSIFMLGCTTDSIPMKNKKSAVMNDPILTYWYCWWRINRNCIVSSGFELLPIRY